MYINIAYKDAPELSTMRRSSSALDLSIEKLLLVNPNCPVRIMLEYIRKKCRLGIFTNFDLCDENGILKGLFGMPTYVYATDQFEPKKTYYVIVIKQIKVYDWLDQVSSGVVSGWHLTRRLPLVYFNVTTFLTCSSIENDKRLSVLPQLNHENKIYMDLKTKLTKYLAAGDVTPVCSPPVGHVPTPGKISPPNTKTPATKPSAKKK